MNEFSENVESLLENYQQDPSIDSNLSFILNIIGSLKYLYSFTTEKDSLQLVQNLCKRFHLIRLDKAQSLYEQGDYRDSFYIVLKGQIAKFVSKEKSKLDDEIALQAQIDQLNTQIHQALRFEQQTRADDIQEFQKGYLSKLQKPYYPELLELLQFNQNRYFITKANYQICNFRVAKVCQAEDLLGKMSLTTLYSAKETMVAVEQTYLLSFQCLDYNQQLGTEKRILMYLRDLFLKIFPIVEEKHLISLAFLAEEQIISRGTFLYKKQEPSNSIFILRDGDLELEYVDQQRHKNHSNYYQSNISSAKSQPQLEGAKEPVKLWSIAQNDLFGLEEAFEKSRIFQVQGLAVKSVIYEICLDDVEQMLDVGIFQFIQKKLLQMKQQSILTIIQRKKEISFKDQFERQNDQDHGRNSPIRLRFTAQQDLYSSFSPQQSIVDQLYEKQFLQDLSIMKEQNENQKKQLIQQHSSKKLIFQSESPHKLNNQSSQKSLDGINQQVHTHREDGQSNYRPYSPIQQNSKKNLGQEMANDQNSSLFDQKATQKHPHENHHIKLMLEKHQLNYSLDLSRQPQINLFPISQDFTKEEREQNIRKLKDFDRIDLIQNYVKGNQVIAKQKYNNYQFLKRARGSQDIMQTNEEQIRKKLILKRNKFVPVINLSQNHDDYLEDRQKKILIQIKSIYPQQAQNYSSIDQVGSILSLDSQELNQQIQNSPLRFSQAGSQKKFNFGGNQSPTMSVVNQKGTPRIQDKEKNINYYKNELKNDESIPQLKETIIGPIVTERLSKDDFQQNDLYKQLSRLEDELSSIQFTERNRSGNLYNSNNNEDSAQELNNYKGEVETTEEGQLQSFYNLSQINSLVHGFNRMRSIYRDRINLNGASNKNKKQLNALQLSYGNDLYQAGEANLSVTTTNKSKKDRIKPDPQYFSQRLNDSENKNSSLDAKQLTSIDDNSHRRLDESLTKNSRSPLNSIFSDNQQSSQKLSPQSFRQNSNRILSVDYNSQSSNPKISINEIKLTESISERNQNPKLLPIPLFYISMKNQSQVKFPQIDHLQNQIAQAFEQEEEQEETNIQIPVDNDNIKIQMLDDNKTNPRKYFIPAPGINSTTPKSNQINFSPISQEIQSNTVVVQTKNEKFNETPNKNINLNPQIDKAFRDSYKQLEKQIQESNTVFIETKYVKSKHSSLNKKDSGNQSSGYNYK